MSAIGGEADIANHPIWLFLVASAGRPGARHAFQEIGHNSVRARAATPTSVQACHTPGGYRGVAATHDARGCTHDARMLHGSGKGPVTRFSRRSLLRVQLGHEHLDGPGPATS